MHLRVNRPAPIKFNSRPQGVAIDVAGALCRYIREILHGYLLLNHARKKLGIKVVSGKRKNMDPVGKYIACKIANKINEQHYCSIRRSVYCTQYHIHYTLVN